MDSNPVRSTFVTLLTVVKDKGDRGKEAGFGGASLGFEQVFPGS